MRFLEFAVALSLMTATSLAAKTLTPPAKGTIKVAFVMSESATMIDFAGPWEVFQDVHVESRGASMEDQMPFELYTVSDSRKPFRTTGGMQVTADYTFDDAPQPHIVVVGAQGGESARMFEWLRVLERVSHLNLGQFYGDTSGRLNAADAVLTRLEHHQPRQLPRHSHQAAFLSFLLKGQYRESSGSRSIDCAPMTLVFHPPETTHDDEIGPEGGTFFMVEIGDTWFDRIRELSRVQMPAMSAQHGAARWLALQLCRAHATGTLSALDVESLLGEILADSLRVRIPEGGSAPWLERVVEQLHAAFAEALTVDGLAREAGVHPVHLSRVFRKRFGMPLGEYVNRLRIDFATRELSRPESKLADIAVAAGFADQSHFSRVVKRVAGATPRELRRMVTD